ncbi:MAG: hypothetical protein KIT84_12085 [Labilithrix sp.]|nr:hypothetical protein [Labilithrix sp.]MCW5811751.1 hypothetical protein [Labilithrix sp.]
MHGRFAVSVLAGFVGSAVAGGCSDDSGASSTTTSTTTSGSPTVSPDTCKSRCNAKAAECGGPASGCAQLCAGSVTEGQVACLEGKSCSQLEPLAEGGDLAAICPVTSSSSSTTTTTSSGGTATDLPESMTITATIPSDYKALHTKQGNEIATLFNVAPKPSFSPEPPAAQFPQIGDKDVAVTVDAPSRGGCDAKFSFVINSEQVGVQFTAVETIPDTPCATFADKIVSDGAKLTLANVPWANSTKTSTVTIELK